MSNTSICASTTLLERKFGVVLILQYIVWDNLQLERICFRYVEQSAAQEILRQSSQMF